MEPRHDDVLALEPEVVHPVYEPPAGLGAGRAGRGGREQVTPHRGPQLARARHLGHTPLHLLHLVIEICLCWLGLAWPGYMVTYCGPNLPPRAGWQLQRQLLGQLARRPGVQPVHGVQLAGLHQLHHGVHLVQLVQLPQAPGDSQAGQQVHLGWQQDADNIGKS